MEYLAHPSAHDQIPEFPDIDFQLGFRTTIDKDTQEAILERIYQMTAHINLKIWLGIKWLSTYISIRPGELIKIKEKQIDLENGYLIVTDTKEKKPKRSYRFWMKILNLSERSIRSSLKASLRCDISGSNLTTSETSIKILIKKLEKPR